MAITETEMNFIKSNIIPIICAVVVLLAIGAMFYPIGKNEKLLKKKMREALSKVATAQSLASNTVHIPGEPVFNGPIVPAVIKAKRSVQQHLASQVEQINRLYAALNARGRVVYITQSRVIPLLGSLRLGSHILPHIPRNLVIRGDFRRAYLGLFARRGRNSYSWLTQLDANSPPSPKLISREVRKRLRAIEASLPESSNSGGRSAVARRQRESLIKQITQKLVYDTALHCRIYASPSSFQIRKGLESGEPLPHSKLVYQGVVDSWLQQDVVNAINELNGTSTDVATSPVKRLIHIAIGADAAAFMGRSGGGRMRSGVAGALFLTRGHSSSSSPVSPAFAPPAGMPNYPQPPMPNYMPSNMPGTTTSKSAGPETPVTHLTSNKKFQVTMMAVSVDIVPSDVNAFIDALYRQNIGYTVLNVNLRSVDPIDALTHGYVFGKTPVVRADILLQVIFLSSWNRKIMPAHYRRELGLTSAKQG
jgi:hypothetical protein